MIRSDSERRVPAYADLVYPVTNFSGGLNTKSSLTFLDRQARYALKPNQLTALDNFVRTASGGLRTRPGRVKLNSAAVAPPAGDAEIRSIFEFRHSNGTDRVIINAGNTIYRWDGSTFVSLGTATTPDKRRHWAQFRNVALGVDGVNTAVSYDGTTLATVAGLSATSTAIASFRDRVWAIDGAILRYSAAGSHTDWTTPNDAGSITIPRTRGQGGVALFPFWDRLIIWTPTQVFQLFGASPSTFQLAAINFRYGHGATPHAIIAAANDVFFMSRRGVHNLAVAYAQSETGDVVYNYASAAIEPTWQSINVNNFSNIVAADDTLRNQIIILCNTLGTQNSVAIVGDYYHLDEFNMPTWSQYTNMPFSSIAEVSSLNGLPEILFGSYDGFVYRQTEDAETDDGVNIPVLGEYQTDLEMVVFDKLFRHLLVFAQSAEGNMTVTVNYDFGIRAQSATFDLAVPGGDLIGSTFVIGTSTLGLAKLRGNKLSFPGHGRFAQIRFAASGPKRVNMAGFVAFAGLRRVLQ
jgi:hypothetical protein